MKRVIVLDLVTPLSYDAFTSAEKAVGGTESTVARVAEGLAATGEYEVIVAQHCRTEEGRGKAIYCSVEDLAKLTGTPFATIALRVPVGLSWLKSQWPDSKLFLWCHDESYNELVAHHDLIAQSGAKILGVSRYHKLRIQDAFLSQLGKFPKLTVDFVYNPVDNDCFLDDHYPPKERPATDPNAFVFFSSPHKGLENTLEQFKHIRRRWKDSRLYVANPGYYKEEMPNMAGVTYLGELSHPEMMKRLASAYCVLHLNPEYPETFGIVHAEAHSLGVPVLTGGTGANREVLHLPGEQIVDVRSTEAIIKRLEKWRELGRPKVQGKAEFRLKNVIQAWQEKLR